MPEMPIICDVDEVIVRVSMQQKVTASVDIRVKREIDGTFDSPETRAREHVTE